MQSYLVEVDGLVACKSQDWIYNALLLGDLYDDILPRKHRQCARVALMSTTHPCKLATYMTISCFE